MAIITWYRGALYER